MSCGLLVSHCCDGDFLMLASLQSSQPCDEIPSQGAAFIITGNALQGRDTRDVLVGKRCINWDVETDADDE